MTNTMPFRGVPAIGDGTTDVAATIQGYLDAAAASTKSKQVNLPSGTFIIGTTLSMASNVSLVGNGRSTILKLKDSANVDLIRNSGHNATNDATTGNTGIAVRNLVLDGNMANQTAYTTPPTEKLGINFAAALDVTVENVKAMNCAGRGISLNGNAAKDGPAFVRNCWALNNQFVGFYIGSGFRRTIINGIVADSNLDSGIVLDVSQITASDLYAWNNNAGPSNGFPGGIYLRNLTGGSFANMQAGSNYRHGIYVGGVRHSSMAGIIAYQSGHLTDNTYDDVHFDVNPDGAGYGNNAFISVAGIKTGRNIQLAAGFDDTANYNRYGLYFDDTSNANIKVTGWQPGTSDKSGPLRLPATVATLSLNGSAIIAANTSAQTLLSWQSGQEFTNEGTTTRVDYTLPAAKPGIEFDFTCMDTDGLRVIATNSAVIRLPDGTTSASNGRVDSTTIGSSMKLRAINTTTWQVKGSQAGWTVT